MTHILQPIPQFQRSWPNYYNIYIIIKSHDPNIITYDSLSKLMTQILQHMPHYQRSWPTYYNLNLIIKGHDQILQTIPHYQRSWPKYYNIWPIIMAHDQTISAYGHIIKASDLTAYVPLSKLRTQTLHNSIVIDFGNAWHFCRICLYKIMHFKAFLILWLSANRFWTWWKIKFILFYFVCITCQGSLLFQE